MGQRPAAALLLLLALAGISWRTAAAATTFTYTTNATKLAAVWVDTRAFEILGGDKAPKFTGSSISAGIIRWDPNDNHYLNPYKVNNLNTTVSAVLSTGDAKLSISKVKYTSESKPTYPDIVNSNIPGSHDAVVLDFWVRAKVSTGAIAGFFQQATNERSPPAVKLHGSTGLHDVYQFDIDGVRIQQEWFDLVWINNPECEDLDCPPTPLDAKMHYYYANKYSRVPGRDDERPVIVKGKVYRIKVRLADTGDRLVDSALYLHKRAMVVF